MEKEIEDYLGEARLKHLQTRFAHLGPAVLGDEIAMAALAASHRQMTPRQRVVFAAIHLLRRAGMRPLPCDIEAWDAASKPEARKAKSETRKSKTK